MLPPCRDRTDKPLIAMEEREPAYADIPPYEPPLGLPEERVPGVPPRDRFCNRSVQEVLQAVFGFPGFRSLQAQAVECAMQGQDALVLMPTGGGKSVCYQIPALCRPGMGLVISPLIALMDDQVAGLRQLGVNAAALHSELDENESARSGLIWPMAVWTCSIFRPNAFCRQARWTA